MSNTSPVITADLMTEAFVRFCGCWLSLNRVVPFHTPSNINKVAVFCSRPHTKSQLDSFGILSHYTSIIDAGKVIVPYPIRSVGGVLISLS